MAQELPRVENIDIELSRENIKYVPKVVTGPIPKGRAAPRQARTDDTGAINSLKKKILFLSNTIEAYKQKYNDELQKSDRLERQNRTLLEDNSRMARLAKTVTTKIEANKESFSQRYEELDSKYSKRLSAAVKDHMKKELMQKAEISRLSAVVEELEKTLAGERERNREKQEELRRKIKEIL